jgi:cystathionine beta-lyase
MKKHTELVSMSDYTSSSAGKTIKTINPTIQSGSTVLFESYEDLRLAQNGEYTGVTYGTAGLSTQRDFEDAICKLENGHSSYSFPSGLSAITNTLMAFTKSGDEVLICDNVYSPTSRFCHEVLENYKVKITHIPSSVGADISKYITSDTSLIFMESPGSNTFEMQDIQEIVKIAQKDSIITVLDNTWATPLFLRPLDLGVDISIHAATKYICGYSDILLGCATVNEKYSDRYKSFYHMLEQYTNPQDCYYALRGLRTLRVRLSVHEKSALEIAEWLQNQNLIDEVIHPALESHPQHNLWKRDYSGSAGLFGFVFKKKYSEEEMALFINSLKLFGLGFSWGGFKSLVTAGKYERGGEIKYQGRHIVRLNIGLEDTEDLIEDLKNSLSCLAN